MTEPTLETARLRLEQPGDEAAIRLLVSSAFGRPNEADLIDRLRDDGDLALSLVAEEAAGGMIGHVAMSRLLSPPNALALAPLAVAETARRRGIGSALVREALWRAFEAGTDAVFVLGEPGFYERFGFAAATAEPFGCVYAGPYFQAAFRPGAAVAPTEVVYPRAFTAAG